VTSWFVMNQGRPKSMLKEWRESSSVLTNLFWSPTVIPPTISDSYTAIYCTLTEVFLNPTEVFLTLTEVFPCFFLSCKANARVKLAKTGHGPYSSTLVVICVVRLLFVLFYVLFVCKCVLPPSVNPIAVNPLNAELNPICYLLALLAYHFLHVSRKRVKSLTLKASNVIYIYIYIWSAYSWCF